MVTSFVGRKNELKLLSNLLRKKTASLVVIKGRRRVGKSRLVEEFAKNIHFYEFIGLAPEKSKQKRKNIQRRDFVRQMKEQGISGVSAQDWGDIFWQLAQHTNFGQVAPLRANIETPKGQVVILLDEISWMANEDADFLPKLKNAWDIHFKKNPQLILVLCGSISSWIDKNILSSTGFFGRISLELTVEELSLSECNAFLNDLGFKGSDYEKFKILSTTGCIPWYLENILGNQNADDNIKRLCFESHGLLVKEFEKIFHDLFDSRGLWYQKIVSLLAKGPAELNAICAKIGYPKSGRIIEYLNDLIKAGFISRDFTWQMNSGKEARFSQFRLKDNYLRFYLKYIKPNLSKILGNQWTRVSMASLPAWDGIMGLQFENLVLNNRAAIHRMLAIRPEDIRLANPYFQRPTNRQSGCQIDYLVQTKYNTLFACEIKFSRNIVTASVVAEVREKLQKLVIPRRFSCFPVLIHVNGVSDEVINSDYFAKIINFSELLQEN